MTFDIENFLQFLDTILKGQEVGETAFLLILDTFAKSLEIGETQKRTMLGARPVGSIETISPFDQWSLTIENH